MAERDSFEKSLDVFIEAMIMRKVLGDKDIMKINPFKVEVTFTPVSLKCHCEGNKKFLAMIEGGEEWFKETSARIDPIMKEQTTKFNEMVKKKFGLQTSEETVSDGTDSFEKFLKAFFDAKLNT